MKCWLFDGPLDGAVLIVPMQVELIVFAADVDRPVVCYRHNGCPGDPDRMLPEYGVILDYVPEQKTIPVTGS